MWCSHRCSSDDFDSRFNERSESRFVASELRLEVGAKIPAAYAVDGLRTKNLMDLEVMAFKAVGRSRHVEAPYARAFLTDFVDRFVEALDQVVDPVTQRQCVLLAQALEVTDFESVRLEHRYHRADLLEFAVGKDVTLDEIGRASCTER